MAPPRSGGAVRIEGMRETLAAIKEFSPKLRRQTAAKMRQASAPLQAAARSRLPAVPMSGWVRWNGRYAYDQGAASGGVKVRVGGAARATKVTWPLVTMSQTDAGGAVFDMAGRASSGNSAQGRAFIATLRARFGGASRSMWPAAEAELSSVQEAVLAAADAAAAEVNRKLARR